MKLRSLRFVATLFTAALWCLAILDGPARAAFPLTNEAGVPSVAPVLRKVTPAVVNIAVRGRIQLQSPLLADPFFRRFFNIPNQALEREVQATGSGVIVDAEHGYVMTNNHVVQHADLIEVTLRDRRSFKARLVGRDPATDIALLQIKADNLTALPFGDSDKLEVGDFVLAIGNPFGLGQTVTSGIVSALGRSGLGIEGFEDFIQTDASINPGNSGGALVDLEGRLIGINTAILAPSGGNVGVGFAVPVALARGIMDQLVRYGRVDHGRVGVAVQDLTPDIAQAIHLDRTDGALVRAIEPDSPAQAAGLRPGDLVVGLNGVPIRGQAEFNTRIALARIHQKLDFTVDRNGAETHVTLEVAPSRQAQRFGGGDMGDEPAGPDQSQDGGEPGDPSGQGGSNSP